MKFYFNDDMQTSYIFVSFRPLLIVLYPIFIRAYLIHIYVSYTYLICILYAYQFYLHFIVLIFSQLQFIFNYYYIFVWQLQKLSYVCNVETIKHQFFIRLTKKRHRLPLCNISLWEYYAYSNKNAIMSHWERYAKFFDVLELLSIVSYK